MSRKFDTLFRPNFDLMSGANWAFVGGASAIAPMFLSLPTEPFISLVAVSVAMASGRLPAGLQMAILKRKLKGADLTFIGFNELMNTMAEHEDSLWLGYGWEWQTHHTQMLIESSKFSQRDIISDKEKGNRKGDIFLHGLNIEETEIMQQLSHTAGHSIFIGTTGSGKTRMFDQVISQAILRNEPVIIIDPKGDRELKENAMRACKLAGKEEAFFYVHPGFPELSCRLDPLRNFNRATELASRIAVLMASENGNPFQAFSQMALNNVIQGMLLKGERPSLVKIRGYLERGTAQLVIDAAMAFLSSVMSDWESQAGPYLARAKNADMKAEKIIEFYQAKVPDGKRSPDLEGLFSSYLHDREHFQKMIASLLPLMSQLTSGSLGPLLSPDALDTEDDRLITDVSRVIRNNEVLYVGLDSLSDAMVGQSIGSILLSDIASVAGDKYNYGVGENKRVNLYVDEVSEVVNQPLIQSLNKGRGAGFVITLATQTLADFAAALNDENKARQVLGNINNKVVLRTTDAETQKYICDSLPTVRTKVIKVQQGSGFGTSDGQDENDGSRLGETFEYEEVPLIPPATLGRLPDLEFFAILVDGRVMKGRIPILTSKDEEAA